MAIDRYIAIHCNKYAIVPRNRPPKRAHLVAEKEINKKDVFLRQKLCFITLLIFPLKFCLVHGAYHHLPDLALYHI